MDIEEIKENFAYTEDVAKGWRDYYQMNDSDTERVAKVIAGRIADKKADYRNYGPWWWPIKRALIAQGLATGYVDEEVADALSFGNGLDDMLCGDAYRTSFLGSSIAETKQHGQYVIHDPDME